MPKLFSRFFLVFLISIISVGCAQTAQSDANNADPITVIDGAGETITLDGPAQRVVSLIPSNTEILFAVGAGEQVVGRDSFSDFPAAALDIPDIGGGFGELDTETILLAEPDLILASEITPLDQVEALKTLGLTVYTLNDPVDFEGLFENIRTVATLVGRNTEAETLIASLSTRLEAVNIAIAPLSYKPIVFYELDGTDPNAPWTAGGGTFVDKVIATAGGFNLGSDLNGAYAQISIEEIIQVNPDVILLGDAVWGGVTPEIVTARAGWDGLKAVQAQQIFPFDDNLVSRPGPRLIDGVEEMARLLHPGVLE